MQKLVYLFTPVIVYTGFSLLGAGLSEAMFPGEMCSLLGAGMGALFMLAWLFFSNRRTSFGFMGNGKAYPVMLFGFLGGAVMSAASSYVMNRLGLYSYFSNTAQTDLLQGNIVLQAVILGILVPVAEEAAYRGMFLDRLQEILPEWAAAGLCALTFAAGHGNMIQFLYALPAGLLLALSAQKSRGLLLPAAIHIGANLCSVLVTAIL